MTTFPSIGPAPRFRGSSEGDIICTTGVWPSLVKNKDATIPPLGSGEGFVFVFTPSTSGWSLASGDSWLSPSGVESGGGYTRLAYEVDSNPGSSRQTRLQVRRLGRTVKSFHVFQFGGSAVNSMKKMVLDPPSSSERGRFPPFSLLIMELGILGKFVAKEIKKAPAEAWPPAVAAVAATIEAVAGVLVASRLGFSEVPEPPDYYSSDPVRMETSLIEKQALFLIEYISEQVSAGG